MSEQTPAPRERRRLRRRRAGEEATPPRDPRAWRSAGIVAGIAALLVVVGVLVPTPAAEVEPEGAVEPVDSSLALCPEPGSANGSRTTSAITVIPDLPGQDRAGEASLGFLDGDAAPDADETDPEAPANGRIDGAITAPGDTAQVIGEVGPLPALEVRTVGGLAPGLVAAQVTQDSFTRGRGLASQPCLGPDTTWWFVGGGSTAGRESALVLVNPEDTPADLEVAISGPDGPVSAPRLRGVVVEPRGRVVVQLAEEAPRLAAAAWRVNVRQGRVMAALFDREEDGFVPRGADWVPAAADPDVRVLIPGVTGGVGSRQLLVHAPGELTATVRVRLITAAGSFIPEAVPEIEVPGGSVTSVELGEALQGEDATVELQSDVPIVAGVRQRHPGVNATARSLEELSFAAGASLIESSAAATGLPAVRGSRVTVWLTAPQDEVASDPMPDDMPMTEESPEPSLDVTDDTAAGPPEELPVDDTSATLATVTLRILAVSAEGTPLPSVADITVSVPQGRLVSVDIPRPEGAAWFTAVASVSGGEVVIAHRAIRRNEDGSLFTGYPWRPLRTSVVVPRAILDPRLAVAGP